MGVHLVFFLHITTGPDNTNNVMALAFGVLIVALVVVGSLLIMADLERQHDARGRADKYPECNVEERRGSFEKGMKRGASVRW